MSQDNRKVTFATLFGLASVCFGTHVGGGFATGNQTVNFYVSYGWVAIFMPVIAMAIQYLVVFRQGLIAAQIGGAGNYKQWGNHVYKPFEKILSPVYEVCYIVILVLAVSGAIAGAASLLETYGIPYGIGVLATGAIFFVLTIFGKELLAKAASFMTICIVVCLLLMCFYGFQGRGENLSQIVSSRQMNIGMGAAVWKMLQYVGFQAYTAATVSTYAAGLLNKSNVSKAMGITFVINAAMIGLTATLLLAWTPDIYGETLPILAICNNTGQGWLSIAYSITLFMAFVSTGIGCIFGFVTRFEVKLPDKMTLIQKRAAISLVSMVVSMAVSMVGLTAIVSIGYSYMGMIGFFIIIMPMATITAYRNYKALSGPKTETAGANQAAE